MDLETISAGDFGKSLHGVGVNLLSRDVPAFAEFLADVFGMKIHRLSKDFAIAQHGEGLIQLHADATYHANPLLAVIPEVPPRGGGVQIYLFDIDPDRAAAAAEARGHLVLEPPTDKPHGLREATILGLDGYAFSPAKGLP